MLQQELQKKGVSSEVITKVLQSEEINERNNILALITKKRRLTKYQDETKLVQYLVRKGFKYDDIKAVLSIED